MYCTVHDLEVMGLNPNHVELGVCSTSKPYLNQKYNVEERSNTISFHVKFFIFTDIIRRYYIPYYVLCIYHCIIY